MPRFLKRHSKKAGLPPGTVVHIGEERVARAAITVIDFNGKELDERRVESAADLSELPERPSVSWINVDGISDLETVSAVGEIFGLHPLTIEDIANTDQRPKVEDFGNYLYVVVRMLRYDAAENEVLSEQLSVVLGRGFVLSLQERPGDVFDPIRERIRKGSGRIRNGGADYLAYRLLDAVVDGYFVVLEKIGERLEALEDELMENPSADTARTIHEIKRELLVLRKATWPLREVVSGLDRSESELIEEHTRVFLRDVYDHAIRTAETVDTFRDMAAGMRDMYMTVVSNKMNEVMKVLTIIATIFIPITFIAGVYGMNFEHMPELAWTWSYPAAIGVMAAAAAGMLLYFRRKKWL